MAPVPNLSARSAVIQGRFFDGRPRIPVVALPPAPVQPRMAGAPPIPPPVPPSHMAQRPVVQPAPVSPYATRRVVQRVGHGEAFQLPASLSNFGGGGGQPLPNPVRRKMESFFNTSFADVRVHVGAQASSIGALAFTQGSNLYFAPGQYNPGTAQGQQLLGHELTHVMQQRAGRVRNPFGAGVAVVQDRAMEAEADRMGLRAAAHAVSVQSKIAHPAGGIMPQLAAPGVALPPGSSPLTVQRTAGSGVVQLEGAGTKPRTFSRDGRFLVKLTSEREQYIYRQRGNLGLTPALPGQYTVVGYHFQRGILSKKIDAVRIVYQGQNMDIPLKDLLKVPSSNQRILVIDTLGYEQGNPRKTSFVMDIKVGTFTKSGAQYSLEGAMAPMRLVKYFEHNRKDDIRGSRTKGFDICAGGDDFDTYFRRARSTPLLRLNFVAALDKIINDIDLIINTVGNSNIAFVGASIFCAFNLTRPDNSIAKLIDPDHPIINVPMGQSEAGIPQQVMTPGHINKGKLIGGDRDWNEYWDKWKDSFRDGLTAVRDHFRHKRSQLNNVDMRLWLAATQQQWDQHKPW